MGKSFVHFLTVYYFYISQLLFCWELFSVDTAVVD